MNQGSNFKMQVMEALFNAPTNLINHKAIMWAASNLPDEGGNGEFSTSLEGDFRKEYNHESENFWIALGLDKEETVEAIGDDVKKIFLEASQDEGRLKKSEIYQKIEKDLGQKGIFFLSIIGFMKLYEQLREDCEGEGPAQNLIDLMKALDQLKRKLGGSDDTKSR